MRISTYISISHAADIPLESVVHNDDVTTIDGQFHTYDSLDQSEKMTTFVVSITDEVQDSNSSSVATYEQPIFSQSQDVSPSYSVSLFSSLVFLAGN